MSAGRSDINVLRLGNIAQDTGRLGGLSPPLSEVGANFQNSPPLFVLKIFCRALFEAIREITV